VDPRFIFAQIPLNVLAAKKSIRLHRLEPRKVVTGRSWAARRAGT